MYLNPEKLLCVKESLTLNLGVFLQLVKERQFMYIGPNQLCVKAAF